MLHLNPYLAFILATELFEQHSPAGICITTPGGLTYRHGTRTQLPCLIDATGEEHSLDTPALQADYFLFLISSHEAAMPPRISFRRYDLTPLLTPAVIEGASDVLRQRGYAAGEAIVRSLAADVTPSNHLKDIVWAAIIAKTSEDAAHAYIQQQALQQEDAPAPAQPPAARRRK